MKPGVAWGRFCASVDRAKALHEDLSGKAHPETQAFYGAGKKHPSCDRIEFRAVVFDWRAAAKDISVAKVVRFVAAPAVGVGVGVGLGVSVGVATFVGFEILKRTEWWQSRGAFKSRIETDKGTIDVELQHPADLARRNDERHGSGRGTARSRSPRGRRSSSGATRRAARRTRRPSTGSSTSPRTTRAARAPPRIPWRSPSRR